MNKIFSITSGFIQLSFIIVFAFLFTYKDASADSDDIARITRFYAMFQDVHVMIFVGFGFLMTYLKSHGFSSVGLNFFIGTLVLQFAMIINAFVHQVANNSFHKVELDITNLVGGDFAAGAILISFGAVLGRITPTQLLWMGMFEVVFYSINEYLGVEESKAVDMGGSMYVHTFGAYFGLAVSFMLGVPKKEKQKLNSSTKNSDMFAMIGTLFLWMFWPSFNGVLAPIETQERVVINTVLALAGSCVTAFMMSSLLCKGKFDMVHIQNASLAGGVAVGSSSDLVIGPFGAIIIGCVAGMLCVLGYVYVSDFLEKKLKLVDTCGVNNLHGMPGIMGGIGGAISAAMAGSSKYGGNITEIFEARDTRSAAKQGWYQASALGHTLAIAIFSGLLVGTLLKSRLFKQKEEKYDDKDIWELPETIEVV